MNGHECAGRFEYVTRRYIDELARARIAELEHRLQLLAAELGVDLDRLELVDRVERRGGYPVTFEECEAIGLDPTTGRPAA